MSQNYIEIKHSNLVFNFSELGEHEKFTIAFQRTLRIPDDNKKYSLPPSLGSFPLEHVEDYQNNLPENWSKHGGVFFPMYQAEAMWMSFSTTGRPFAIKVASGKVNAVSGKPWDNKLKGKVKVSTTNEVPEGPNLDDFYKINQEANLGDILKSEDRINGKNQKDEPDYMVSPNQPWLDGFNVGKGVIRQFVAVPLDSGYTVEEQVTGVAEHGGIQIIVYPMKEELWQKIQAEMPRSRGVFGGTLECAALSMTASASSGVLRSKSAKKPDMGLGAGGMMTQQIYEDTYGVDAWDETQSLRVFVHLANSEQYKEITGKMPPTEPVSAETYRRYNYPWFDYYSDAPVLSGSDTLAKVDSIGSMQTKKGEQILPDNGHEPAPNQPIIQLGQKPKKTIKGGSW